MEDLREKIDRFADVYPGLDEEGKQLLYEILTYRNESGGDVNININDSQGDEYDQSGNKIRSRNVAYGYNYGYGPKNAYGQRGRSRYGRKDKEYATTFEKTVGVFSFLDLTVKALISTTQKLIKHWSEMDSAATKFAKSAGMTGAAREHLRIQTLERNHNQQLAAKFGVSGSEMVDLKANIYKGTGRKAGVTEQGEETLAALTNLTGAGNTQELISKLDAFGIGIKEAGELTRDMFADASEEGVDFEAYSKNFLDNIEMAQTYNFKDGVEGVKSMAKKATELQISMKTAASFADKVGNLQGAIEAGAQLQSLGGNFMQFSNPLAMLSESLTDTDALFDRMTNMFSGMGTFDKETGQVKLNSVDRRRARAASEAMGISYDEMMKGITNKGRREEITRAIDSSGVNLDDETRRLLLNIGTFQDGKAGYVDKNGQFKDLENVNAKDLAELQALNRTDSQNLSDMAINIRSISDKLSFTKKQKENDEALIAEETGIGESVGKLVDFVNGNKGLIKAWAYASMAYYVAQGASTIGSGLSNVASLFKDAKGIPGAIKGAISGFKNGGGIKGAFKGAVSSWSSRSAASAMPATGGMPYFGGYPGPYSPQYIGQFAGQGMMPGAMPGYGFGTFNPLGGNNNTSGGGTIVDTVTDVIGDVLEPGGNKPGAAKGGIKGKLSGFGESFKSLKNVGKGAKFLGGAAAAIGLASDAYETFDAYKNGGRHEQTEKTSQLAGNAIGTTIGAVFGGPVGAAIGGWIGSTAGKYIGKGINAINDKARAKKRKELGISDKLEGDYNKKELEQIANIIKDGRVVSEELNGLSEKTRKKFIESGDSDKYMMNTNSSNFYKIEGMAEGGIVPGDSYEGDKVLARVNSGEMTINKKDQGSLFNFIKGATSFLAGIPFNGAAKTVAKAATGASILGGSGEITPSVPKLGPINIFPQIGLPKIFPGRRESNAIKPAAFNPSISIASQDKEVKNNNGKLEISPLNVNFSGDIKITDGKGGNIDLGKELLNNNKFKSELVDVVVKSINIRENVRYNADNR